MITGTHLHDPPPFNGPFFMTPPFSESQKVVTLPLFPTNTAPRPLLLISDKSLRKESNSYRNWFKHQYARRFIVLEHRYGRRDVM